MPILLTLTTYGWEKLYTEKMCEAYQRDYGWIYCTFSLPWAIMVRKELLKVEAENRRGCYMQKSGGSWGSWKHFNLGRRKQTRSYCYVDDAVKATIMLMDSDYNKPINIDQIGS